MLIPLAFCCGCGSGCARGGAPSPRPCPPSFSSSGCSGCLLFFLGPPSDPACLPLGGSPQKTFFARLSPGPMHCAPQLTFGALGLGRRPGGARLWRSSSHVPTSGGRALCFVFLFAGARLLGLRPRGRLFLPCRPPRRSLLRLGGPLRRNRTHCALPTTYQFPQRRLRKMAVGALQGHDHGQQPRPYTTHR